jgi:hypothetical protein
MWVSRVARTRILALADTLKRKHKHLYDYESKNKNKGVKDESHAFGIEGMDGRFSTKAAMKRAWVTQSKPNTPAISAQTSRRPSGEDWPVIDLTRLDTDEISSVGGMSLMPDGDGGSRFYTRSENSAVVSRPRTQKVLPKAALELIHEIERYFLKLLPSILGL